MAANEKKKKKKKTVRGGRLLGAEGLDAGDGAAEDEGVDVVRALVGVDGLQVHDVPDDVVLVLDAVAAEHVAAGARNVQRFAARVALQQRDHLRRRPATNKKIINKTTRSNPMNPVRPREARSNLVPRKIEIKLR